MILEDTTKGSYFYVDNTRTAELGFVALEIL
jgi:hypothetical protein